MNSKRLFCFVVAITISSGFPRAADGQRSGVEIWAATCGNCHVAQPANRYTAKDWDAIGTHMVITARLTDAQADAVMDFLKSNSRSVEGDADANENDGPAAGPSPRMQRPGGTVLTQEQSAAEQYGKLCAPCHGRTGRGDGPAAVALTPRPLSFADSTFQASRTDEELIKVITEGKAPMPTFGKQLSPAQVRALVAYVRTLGEEAGRQRPPAWGSVPFDFQR